MNVLIWKSKHEDVIINATNKEAAFYKLFCLIEEGDNYADLKEPDCKYESQKKWYQLALSGDTRSAAMLVHDRRDYEYENFDIVEVIEP